MATTVYVHERECAVCTNDFTTPKILPCGHLLCRECVISWMDSKSDAGCPLCTCPIVERQGHSSQSSADVADALPTDYVMEAIVESARMLMKEDICPVCNEVRAEYICMQCVEKMCQSCMNIHTKMVATRSHDVESLSTVTPERLAASRPALCADHGDKHGELFCVCHNLVICTSCFSNKHNECPNVKHLDNNIKSSKKTLGSMTEKLLKAEDNLKQAIVNLNMRVHTANVTEQENMALVDKTCDRLQKMVKGCRKQLKKLISDSVSKFKNSLCDVKRELEKRLGKVTSHKHVVTRATTVRPRPALMHAARTLTDRVNSLDLSTELEPEAWVDPWPEITKYCDDGVIKIKAELQRMEQQRTVPVPVLVFYENCLTNIRLTNCRTTAQSVNSGNGMVVSRDAMRANVLYEVRIDKINEGNTVQLFVTNILPALLNVTTGSKDQNMLVSILTCEAPCENVYRNFIGAKNINVGSRVGVLMDSSNDLHPYVNGNDQGVVAKSFAHPCFIVFRLHNGIQVTALPTSRRTRST